jgi:hypothetical protein
MESDKALSIRGKFRLHEKVIDLLVAHVDRIELPE